MQRHPNDGVIFSLIVWSPRSADRNTLLRMG